MGTKRQTNARIPLELHEIVTERAQLMEVTRGGYMALIAQWWIACGSPSVNERERRLSPRKSARGRSGPGR